MEDTKVICASPLLLISFFTITRPLAFPISTSPPSSFVRPNSFTPPPTLTLTLFSAAARRSPRSAPVAAASGPSLSPLLSSGLAVSVDARVGSVLPRGSRLSLARPGLICSGREFGGVEVMNWLSSFGFDFLLVSRECFGAGFWDSGGIWVGCGWGWFFGCGESVNACVLVVGVIGLPCVAHCCRCLVCV